MKLKVNFIDAQETHALRHEILRPGRPMSEIFFSDDDTVTTFHVGVSCEEINLSPSKSKVMTVATFVKETPPPSLALFLKMAPTHCVSYRLRGMATAENCRQQGSGKMAIEFAQTHLIILSADLLWFNAREVAFPFYEKLGFKYHGDFFDIAHVGPHKVMYKRMKSDSV